ncbi:MAG: hypothetical protein AAF692_02530 [Pseudomonadota bacterium]
MLIVVGLAGCADLPSGSVADRLAPSGGALVDPPGAALPLSIGGRIEPREGDLQAVAIPCVAALDMTAKRLAAMADTSSGPALAVFQDAQAYYLDQASRLSGKSILGPEAVSARVRQYQDEKAGEVRQQAQFAITCLRRYGESLEASASDT